MARKRRRRIVIIGNSAAGLSGLEALRKRDPDCRVVLIDEEPYPAYSRVITPYFVLGSLKEESGLFLRDRAYYRRLGVKTLFGRRVVGLDVRNRDVLLDNGKKEPFDLLLIATGSSPIRPKIRGAKPDEIHVLRSLEDARRLKALKPTIRQGLFLGGGLVSLQSLQALFRREGRYTVVVKSDHLLSQQLDPEGAEMIEKRLRGMGVQVLKGRDVIQLKRRKGSLRAVLDTGEELETDFLFAGKGVRPNIDFLRGTGIETKGGILVNRQMETNIEGIYAAGDVAVAPDFFSGEEVLYGLWSSAVEQGAVAGTNMAGQGVDYEGNLKMNVTRIFAVPVASIGEVRSTRVAESLVRKDERRGIYRKFCFDGQGRLIGAILIEEVEDLGVIQGLIRKRKDGAILKTRSLWRSPVNYGLVFKGLLQGRP
ncbi:MAG: FAD-dependent oxidoreductase [Desulfobacterota bacterium]|nr:FAD-dependent oxidoreductase [Thermodesulfobacteriota bacterium]